MTLPRFLVMMPWGHNWKQTILALKTALGDDLLIVSHKKIGCKVAPPDEIDHAMAQKKMVSLMRRKASGADVKSYFGSLAHIPWVRRFHLARKVRKSARLRRALSEVLETHPGILPLILNGSTLPQAALAAVADPGWRLFLDRGYFRNTLQIDHQGINAGNSLPRDPEFYRSYATVHQPTQEIPQSARRRAMHAEAEAVDLPERYVFAPFQFDEDTDFSPWLSSMQEFYDALVAVADTAPGLMFVVKEHPELTAPLHGQVPQHPRVIFQNGRDTGELIRGAAAVVTVNSTVGIEALSQGRKVIVLGECCYDVPELVRRARSIEELKSQLNSLDEWELDDKVRTGFLAYLAREFLFRTAPLDDNLAQRLLALPSRDHRDALTKRPAHDA